MPPKRHIINVDDDVDSDVVELLPTPPTAPRPPKNPRTMPLVPSSVPISNAPRPAPGTTIPTTQHFFQIRVGTHGKYEQFFPDRTLGIIAALHREEVQAVMRAYQYSIPLSPRYTYRIISGTAVGSATDFTSVPVGPSTPSLSFSNAYALEHFLSINKRFASMKERPKYIMLAAIKGVKNPRFAHLHAVRYDEVGCGFDEDNCLSLLVTEFVGGERQTKVLYVERTEVVKEVDKQVEVPNIAEAGKAAKGVKAEGDN